ncbi:MAG TPA: AMP-binding protein [Acidimicrobiales bacterium]|nr:AMP-binding protein [Acidimicrobiales bacterium]
MDPTCESPLVAIHLPAPEAARAVRRAWDDGAAVVVLDPRAPAARVTSVLEALVPTHLVDAGGTRRMARGRPAAAGVAAVVTTSGTTGEPRHVVLRRSALEASARAVSAVLEVVPGDDRWLACVPLHYVAGLAIVARSYFCETALTVHPTFDVAAVAASAGEATLVSLVPTMLSRLLDAGRAPSGFHRVLVGGSPVAPSLRRVAEDAGVRISTTYGLSETGGGCVHDGTPLPGVELSTSSDDEILVRGPVVMDGYLGDDLATARAFTADGWLRTGDLGRIDARGILSVTDRLKDIVITGGVKVSPTAVERVLGDHPAVADVGVVGLPDEHWGERVVAFVVPRPETDPPTLGELRSFGSHELTAAELPRELRLVASLSRSPSGKLLRSQLRDAEG